MALTPDSRVGSGLTETSPAPPGVAAAPRARRETASGQFLPGAMVAGRYRMIGLLGRGGMGEVYRADDMKLGQPVALKFLPFDVVRDPGRLERFLTEVRVSLRVTHPNVCRVFDVGDLDGRHFLSMEFVDGEDLASLLRRIGRLPDDKAVEIARQLCAGSGGALSERTDLYALGLALYGGVLIARRNLRLDRADTRGAIGLAAYTGGLTLIAWLFDEHHVASIWELYLFVMALSFSLFSATLLAVFYVALEPSVRRTWPEVIVGWSRVLAGNIRDPLVARDVLVGCASGVVYTLIPVAGAFTAQQVPQLMTSSRPFFGVTAVAADLAMILVNCVFFALFSLFLFFIVRLLVRRPDAAILLCGLILGTTLALANSAPLAALPFWWGGMAILFAVLARVGLVAIATTFFVGLVLMDFPFSWPASAWYSGVGFVGVALVSALAIAAFRIATAAHTDRRGQVQAPA